MEKSPQQESWRKAMDAEFDNLKLRNVWKLTILPPDKRLLGCRWAYNLKRDENGKVIRYKARLVAVSHTPHLTATECARLSTPHLTVTECARFSRFPTPTETFWNPVPGHSVN
ncbi:hypothetical protein TNCV_4328351 [Trichonephila clavipes]|nr:hypothetical protein TNCV_4328351 [Trichonephila clavipes]